MQLNDVSARFNLKMKEAELVAAKREGIDVRKDDKPMLPPGSVEDDDRIKFISMID
jgi:hypothetical protein